MHEIKRLTARHQQIMRLLLLGTSQTQIARLVGVTTTTVSLVVNSPLFKEEFLRRQSSIDDQVDEQIASELSVAAGMIQNAAVHAVMKVDELAHHAAEESVQLRAAETILKTAFARDSSGGSQLTQVFVLGGDQLKALQAVAKEAGLFDEPKTVESTVVS
jgi:predicted transcriptional regulator